MKYIDEENERITFSSNEELRTAIKMKSDSKPLKIIIVANQPKATSTLEDHQGKKFRGAPTCDKCEGPLVYVCCEGLVKMNSSSTGVHSRENLRTRSTTSGCRGETLSCLMGPCVCGRHSNDPIRPRLVSHRQPERAQFEIPPLPRRRQSRKRRKSRPQSAENSDATADSSVSSHASGTTLDPFREPYIPKSNINERTKRVNSLRLPPVGFGHYDNSETSRATTYGTSADASRNSTRRPEELSVDGVIRLLEAYRMLQP